MLLSHILLQSSIEKNVESILQLVNQTPLPASGLGKTDTHNKLYLGDSSRHRQEGAKSTSSRSLIHSRSPGWL